MDKSGNDNVSNPSNFDKNEIDILSNLSIKNVNQLIVGNLNINSKLNKFDQLRLLIERKVNISLSLPRLN